MEDNLQIEEEGGVKLIKLTIGIPNKTSVWMESPNDFVYIKKRKHKLNQTD